MTSCKKGRQVTQAICGEKGNAMSFTLALLNQLINKLIKAQKKGIQKVEIIKKL